MPRQSRGSKVKSPAKGRRTSSRNTNEGQNTLFESLYRMKDNDCNIQQQQQILGKYISLLI